MARKYSDRYVRFYTVGSAAAKPVQEMPKASLPEPKKPEKRKPIPFDPVAFFGSAVAVLLAVLMVVGLFQVAHTTAQVRMMEGRILNLEMEQELLRERYENGYDLDEIRAAAQSMGMIPAEEAGRIRVSVPAETIEPLRLSWWDSLMVSLRQFFA